MVREEATTAAAPIGNEILPRVALGPKKVFQLYRAACPVTSRYPTVVRGPIARTEAGCQSDRRLRNCAARCVLSRFELACDGLTPSSAKCLSVATFVRRRRPGASDHLRIISAPHIGLLGQVPPLRSGHIGPPAPTLPKRDARRAEPAPHSVWATRSRGCRTAVGSRTPAVVLLPRERDL